MKRLIALLVIAISGCTSLLPPYVERAYSECIRESSGTASYTVTGGIFEYTKRAECKR